MLFFLLAVFLQWSGGAYRSEFGAHPDEAAHYVTGLLVRDFLITPHAWAHPKQFAEEFYRHYPKVGLGVWPPVFYLVQTAWTLVFGVSRASVLALMAALAASLALVFYETLRKEFGRIALAGALALLALPLVQSHYSMVMAETLSALTMFSAAIFFGKFLDEQNSRDALGFALSASAAILTKGTGLALALVPPLAILFTRKFSVLKNRRLWIAALLVLVLAGPWTFATRNLGKGGWLAPNPSWYFTQHALGYYAQKLFVSATPLVALLALIGVVVVFRSKENRGLWLSFFALAVSVWIFQSIAPVGLEARHLIPAMPAIMAFAFVGILRIGEWIEYLGIIEDKIGGVVVVCWNLTLFLFWTIHHPHKNFSGFGPVADKLLADPANRGAVFLVSSDASGEGMFIAEVAMRERGKFWSGHVVERASKTFTPESGFAQNWSGAHYRARFSSDDALRDFLLTGDPGKNKIDILVVDESVPERNRVTHHEQLARVIAANPQHFQLIAESPLVRAGVRQKMPVRAYRIFKMVKSE